MKRRELLITGGAALLGLSTFRLGWTAPADKKKQKVLYFTRSAGFEHSVVKRNGNEPSFSDKLLTAWGKDAGFDVECTKDGGVFDGDLDQYDAFAFYTTGVLTNPKSTDNTPPMTAAGKQKFLDAIAGGKGFVGFHSATDSFHSDKIDPYISMIGAEFVIHGAQQKAAASVISPDFPGIAAIGAKELTLLEEWYTMKRFANDLHVILRMETKGMTGPMYQRPPYPATWARKNEKGRVFYTSFGHREDIWENPKVKSVMLGGIAWAMGNVAFDPKPNIAEVAPGANELPKPVKK